MLPHSQFCILLLYIFFFPLHIHLLMCFLQIEGLLFFASDARKSRKVMPVMGESSRPSGYDLGTQEGGLEISNLILRLLSSKDGTVIRRLLMSAVWILCMK